MTTTDDLLHIATQALDDLKAQHVTVLPVSELTSIADYMVIATGTSSRHVKALAQEVEKKAKQAGFMPIGTEGEQSAEWLLVDLGDVIVHLMQASAREFYDLERLWQNPNQKPINIEK